MKSFTFILIAAFNAVPALTFPFLSEVLSEVPSDNDATPLLQERAALPTKVWQPNAGASWQIVLSSLVNPSALGATASKASIFNIDLFDNSAATIDKLRSAPLNKKVICYFSAGSYEPNRPDSGSFTSSDKGNVLEGWEDEKWLNIRSTNVRNIMVKRLQLAARKGCDGVDPDNVDGYQNNNGLKLTKQDSINYVKFLASHAASLKLAIGLKNAGDIIANVLPNVQFAVNEECAEFSECGLWTSFTKVNKPVFHIEYPPNAPNVAAGGLAHWCKPGDGSMAGFSTVLKKMDLGGQVQLCDGTKYSTPTIGS